MQNEQAVLKFHMVTKSGKPWTSSAFEHALEWGDGLYHVEYLKALSMNKTSCEASTTTMATNSTVDSTREEKRS